MIDPPLQDDRGASSAVFLSYCRPDRARVEALAAVLEKNGLLLWWDALIEGGDAFAKSIESALDMADVVVVAWSKDSVKSDWVRDEAAHGRDRGRFVPISLDGTQPPLGFRQYHFIEFTHWNGAASAPEVAQLLRAIAAARLNSPRDLAQATTPPLAKRGTAPRLGRRTVLLGGGGAALLAGSGILGWRMLAPPAAAANSIAVLPFRNLSGDPAQGYFSDGLSEELRARLGEGGLFKVAAQNSSNLFRDKAVDAVTIGARLSVAYLLDGSVRRSADTLRIVTELIDTRTGLSQWTHSYDRQFTDIFSIQAEIAATVMQAIAGQLPVAVDTLMAASGTMVATAYDFYLKGRAQYLDDSGAQADRDALASFDAAIAADPRYAQAHAMRAETLLDIASTFAEVRELPGLYAGALTSAQTAVGLAPTLAMAQLAMGEVILQAQLNVRTARPYFDKALALGSHDASILTICAGYFARIGQSARALDMIKAAIDLDRLNPLLYDSKGMILYYARRYSEAIEVIGQALALNPRLVTTHAWIGYAMIQLGQLAPACAQAEREQLTQDKLTVLAIANHRLNDQARAQQNFAELVNQFGDRVLFQQGIVLAQWNQPQPALTALEKARTLADTGLVWAQVDPLLDPLRNEPRFKTLLASMGFG